MPQRRRPPAFSLPRLGGFSRGPASGPADRYPGDRLGFGDKITGDDSGYDREVCTIFARNQAMCTVVLKLSKGTLNVEGLVPNHSNKTPFAVTGGTGAYNGARGTLVATDTNSSTAIVQVTLLP